MLQGIVNHIFCSPVGSQAGAKKKWNLFFYFAVHLGLGGGLRILTRGTLMWSSEVATEDIGDIGKMQAVNKIRETKNDYFIRTMEKDPHFLIFVL